MPLQLAQESNRPIVAYPWMAQLRELYSLSNLFSYHSFVPEALESRFNRVERINLVLPWELTLR